MVLSLSRNWNWLHWSAGAGGVAGASPSALSRPSVATEAGPADASSLTVICTRDSTPSGASEISILTPL